MNADKNNRKYYNKKNKIEENKRSKKESQKIILTPKNYHLKPV
jgi:hypothetical protein